MFKVDNLDQINSLTYKPIDRKNKYKYIIINKQYIDKKYEIGKRYKHDIVFYDNLSGLPSYAISKSENFKIMEIKLFGRTYYDIANDFKIVREINYLDLLDSDDIVENMISAIKNHEKIVLDAFLSSKEKIYLEVVVNSGVHKYLDKIITEYINGETKYGDMVSLIIREYGRNKDLDNFINCNNDEIKCRIANVGRPQDLDILMESKNNCLISKILRHGRENDVNIYIKNFDDTIFQNIIVETGIDKYMDYIIENNFENIHEILLADIGRKKDLDKIIKTKNEYVLSKIINKQYKEHLLLLSHHYYSDISNLAKETFSECNL